MGGPVNCVGGAPLNWWSCILEESRLVKLVSTTLPWTLHQKQQFYFIETVSSSIVENQGVPMAQRFSERHKCVSFTEIMWAVYPGEKGLYSTQKSIILLSQCPPQGEQRKLILLNFFLIQMKYFKNELSY